MEEPDVVQKTLVERITGSSSIDVIRSYFADDEKTKVFVQSLYNLVRRSGLVHGDHQAVREMAREIMSEVVEEAFEHSDRYNPQHSLVPWLYGIAVNMIKRRQQKGVRLKEISFSALSQTQGEADYEEILDRSSLLVAEGPEHYVEVAEQNEQLNEAFARLSMKDQQVLHLTLQYNCDYAKLAEVLGITQAAVRQRYHRATTRLREIIQKQGEERNG
jgi:RNA polymerase sigma-70 factor (ECF subfamily)